MTRQYQIAQETVRAAWKLVKANKGAPGIDGQTITEFEENADSNIYKIWNRMTSGSYFPPPVRTVNIPKNSGGHRMLGIPTVSDRVAQQVTKMYLEPIVDPKFHNDSFGYRPGRSQHHALAVAKKRCWKYDWVLEVDIKGYFDNIDHELMMMVLKTHTEEKWVLLYVERWLKAEIRKIDGTTISSVAGSPQGSVISPLLSNIFLHHAFDTWMTEKYSHIPFERFADDMILHCKSKEQAEYIKDKLVKRLEEWKLEIHPTKTRIVYCKDSKRGGSHEPFQFTFLSYDFKPRRAENSHDHSVFTSYLPAIGMDAKAGIYQDIREWKLKRRTQATLNEISESVNAQIRGWLNYFDKFYGSALNVIAKHIDARLLSWAMRKYKRFQRNRQAAAIWLEGIEAREPELFAHWCWRLRDAE